MDNYYIDVKISVESYIVFQGDLSIFRKPSKRGWLKSNFSKIELEKEIIKCFHNNISNPDFIFEIKRSLVKTFKNVNFNFLGSLTIDTWNNTKSIELMLDDIIYSDLT